LKWDEEAMNEEENLLVNIILSPPHIKIKKPLKTSN
jgi:hypothetical protein